MSELHALDSLDTLPLPGDNRPAVQPSISFCIRGLEPKDGRLFKSFVRLVSHRTVHAWVFKDDVAEVCVAPSVQHQGGSPHVLTVVHGAVRGPSEVQFPFQAADLEATLNALGQHVLRSRSARPPAAEWNPAMPFRLVRWPPADLVNTPQRMRLATAMSGRGTSIEALATRTSVPHEACLNFARELQAHGLLSTGEGALAPVGPAAAGLAGARGSAGVLARIRSRLSRISRIGGPAFER